MASAAPFSHIHHVLLPRCASRAKGSRSRGAPASRRSWTTSLGVRALMRSARVAGWRLCFVRSVLASLTRASWASFETVPLILSWTKVPGRRRRWRTRWMARRLLPQKTQAREGRGRRQEGDQEGGAILVERADRLQRSCTSEKAFPLVFPSHVPRRQHELYVCTFSSPGKHFTAQWGASKLGHGCAKNLLLVGLSGGRFPCPTITYHPLPCLFLLLLPTLVTCIATHKPFVKGGKVRR